MEEYYYIEELCPVYHYRGLFPVAYEKDGETYRKKGMYCQLVAEGKCKKSRECAAWMAAPDTLDPSLSWRLQEKPFGRE
jgi:hypothetical protein